MSKNSLCWEGGTRTPKVERRQIYSLLSQPIAQLPIVIETGMILSGISVLPSHTIRDLCLVCTLATVFSHFIILRFLCFSCGRCRIRTYGTLQFAGFQDQCIRPLCQSSKRSPWANLPDKRGFGSFGVSTILEVNPYLYPYNCSFTTSLCEPDRIRTCDRLLRRQMLYPAELRVHSFSAI